MNDRNNITDHVLIPGSVSMRRILHHVQTDPDFAPFQDLPPSLIGHLLAETLCMPLNQDTKAFATETRLMFDNVGEKVGGFIVCMDIPWDDYHPHQFKPFKMRAIWIPEQVGDLFLSNCPFPEGIRRTHDGIDQILFPIHPKSEKMYQPLLEKYSQSLLKLTAISLSSCRTLLLALPTADNSWHYVIVKVSIDQEIGGHRRIINPNGCAIAVANTNLLENRLPDYHGIIFMQETIAFVPHQTLISSAPGESNQQRAGIIYRQIPELLLNNNKNCPPYPALVPIFALFGKQNRPFFKKLVAANGGCATDFIINCLLQPYAEACVELLYFKQVSIEAHAQNLLFALDANLRITGLVYRDMGGVNCLATQSQIDRLPANQQGRDHFYFDTHFRDAALAIEDCFIDKILFNLTKQMLNTEMDQNDCRFAAWKATMKQQDFLDNWTVGDSADDRHESRLHVQKFYRYGYVERLFAGLLLDELERRGIFDTIDQLEQFEQSSDSQALSDTLTASGIFSEIVPTQVPYLVNHAFFAYLLNTPPQGYRSPCIDRYWFKELIILSV